MKEIVLYRHKHLSLHNNLQNKGQSSCGWKGYTFVNMEDNAHFQGKITKNSLEFVNGVETSLESTNIYVDWSSWSGCVDLISFKPW